MTKESGYIKTLEPWALHSSGKQTLSISLKTQNSQDNNNI